MGSRKLQSLPAKTTAFLLMSLFFMYNALCTASPTGNTKNDQTCETSGCIRAAWTLFENMDTTSDPCNNFYQFACGTYLKNEIIRDDKTSISTLGNADDRLLLQLKESIEEKIGENDSRTLQLLKSYYNVCLNTEKTEDTSIRELLHVLENLGGWPLYVGKSWSESNFNWINSVYRLRRLGYAQSMNSLITLGISIDEKNSSRHAIIIDQATLGLERQYLVEGAEDKVVHAYNKYMVSIAKTLGVNHYQAKRELAESLLFEIEIAKISSSDEERANMSQLYNRMTVEELQVKYSDIPWTAYLNEFLGPVYAIQPTEHVIVKNLNYLKSLIDLIARTPKRVLANYMLWRVVEESIPFLNKQILKLEAQFIATTLGTKEPLPRWVQCLNYVNENIPVAVGTLYVRKVFDKSLKKEVEELVDELRKSFKKLLEKVDWMDPQTKRTALKKLHSIHSHVAYPHELLDDEKLDKYFKNLEVPDSYLDGYLRLNLFFLDFMNQLPRKPVNKTDWTMHGGVAVVNAFYQDSENSIQIPAGYIQEELFDKDRPTFMNYAAIGFFIGHELTHGFDDEGSQYDENGNLKNWWSDKTQKEYQKRTQCVIDQYSNYTVSEVGMKLNGQNTLGENIADNGGIKEAYYAYEDYERRNGPEPRLPGLPFSPRQLFWLSYGNIWCEKYRIESMESNVITDFHSPGEFRVIGPLSNMPEFSRDFDCPVGSPMNPVKKCIVW